MRGNAWISQTNETQSLARQHAQCFRKLRQGFHTISETGPYNPHVCARCFYAAVCLNALVRFDHQMFVDDSPAGAAYIIINDKGEKVLSCASCSTFCFTLSRFCRCTCRILFTNSAYGIVHQVVLFCYTSLVYTLTPSAAGYAGVSALLDGVPESKESQQKYLPRRSLLARVVTHVLAGIGKSSWRSCDKLCRKNLASTLLTTA